MKLTAEKCFVAYWLIALLTFGYVASGTNCEPSIFSTNSRSECAALKGMMGGALWPLYWTWEGFSIGRQALKGGTE